MLSVAIRLGSGVFEKLTRYGRRIDVSHIIDPSLVNLPFVLIGGLSSSILLKKSKVGVSPIQEREILRTVISDAFQIVPSTSVISLDLSGLIDLA